MIVIKRTRQLRELFLSGAVAKKDLATDVFYDKLSLSFVMQAVRSQFSIKYYLNLNCVFI